MQKKLLAILGSPHEDGSTAAMLACAVEVAKEAGWQVETISLYRKRIAYCQGCRSCVETGQCVLADDLQAIAVQWNACDRVVLAAPVYWANVPAIVKNLFDRLLGTVLEETTTFPRPRLSGRRDYLLLTACNAPFPFSWLGGQSRGALRAMDAVFRTAGMKRLGCVVFTGARDRAVLPAKVARKIAHFWT